MTRRAFASRRQSHVGRLRCRGFTLVEVLVAVLVFGVLATAAYTGLNTLTSTASGLDERAEAFANLQRTVAAVDQDLRQLIGRAARANDGRTRPAFEGRADGLTGRRAGRISRPGSSRSQLQAFAWQQRADRSLVRVSWHELGASGTPDVVRPWLDECEEFRLRYRDGMGRWSTRWPMDGAPEALPDAIEYTIVHPRFGSIRRLIVL